MADCIGNFYRAQERGAIILPAAAWYLIIFCVRFFRATHGKNVHNIKGKYRSAEGSMGFSERLQKASAQRIQTYSHSAGS